MPYNLIYSHASTTSVAVDCPTPISAEVLVIKPKCLVVGKDWIRFGWIAPIVDSNIGPIQGKGEPLIFGQQQLKIIAPSLPYRFRLIPRNYVRLWEVEVYEVTGYDTPELPIVQCIDSIQPTFDGGYQ